MNRSILRTRHRALSTVSFSTLSLAAVVMAGAATGALAQTAAPAAPAAAPSDSTVVVVTGFRQSYANAVKTKRDSIEITDSISSDGLGRFPDLNVGEAIQRIPGIQLNREADSRNATIALRGLPGTFARTTLNGTAFADPILSSATNTASTPLGAFDSDIFSSITVVKSPDAADLAGGLSGDIDLRIAPALQRKDGGSLKVSDEYDTLGKLNSPNASLTYNKHFGHDFAVFGSIAYKDEKFRRDSISVNAYSTSTNKPLAPINVGNQLKAGSNPVYDALAAQFPGGVFVPQQMRQFSRMNLGHLLSSATGFEWRLNDNLKIGTTGFYTERFLNQGTNDLQYDDASAGLGTATTTSISSTSAVTHYTSLGTPFVVQTPSGPKAYINQFSAENLIVYDSTRSEPDRQSTWSINPTIDFKNDKWHLWGELTMSRANVLANQIEIDVIQNPSKAGASLTTTNGITTSVYTGGTDLSKAVIQINTPNALHVDVNGYPVASAASQATQAADAAGNKFGVTGSNGQSNNFLNAAQADAERSFKDGFLLSSVQFGVRTEKDRFESTGSRNTSLGSLTANINGSIMSQEPATADFFGGKAPGLDTNWLHANVPAVLAAITPVNIAALPAQFTPNATDGVFLTPYGLVNNYWDPNYYSNNFTNNMTVNSAYLMAKFDQSPFNIHVRGNFGVRYEDTHDTITALDCNNCSSTTSTAAGPVNHSMVTRTYNQHYHYALPSFLAAADLTDNLVLRLAAYETYVRPQPRDTVPITTVQAPDSTQTVPTYTAVIGATNLKPYTSNSYDLALEWYNRPGGLISIDTYQKHIHGFIGPITDVNTLCPADGKINGVDYGLGSLSRQGTACVSSNTFTNSTNTVMNAVVNISGQTNQSPMVVTGVELSVQQNLDFLPSFWKNFGGAFNYAYTRVNGHDTSGNPIALTNVSKNNTNFITYYETKLWGVRLVYNWRDKYPLAAGNSFVGDARIASARSQLDASASYNISSRVSVSVDAFNLTDAKRSEYENDPRLPRRVDYDGRTYEATLKASF